MVAPIILLEAMPRRATDGGPVVVRLAGGGGEAPYFYNGQHWLAGIVGIPNAIASLEFDGEQLGGNGAPQAMELRWAPSSSAAIEELQALYWADAPVTVRIGPEGALPPIDVAGLAVDGAVQNGTLSIALSDQTADLRRSVLGARFAGTGGIEGPAEWADLIKSRCIGRCFNVPGQLLDRANQIWCFGDPARAWLSFDSVRDKGVAPAAAAITVLAWQGSVAATFAALQAAKAVDGGGVLCPSIACIKWWTEPAGDLRADVRGEIEGSYAETAPQIAERIVAARSTLPFKAGAVAAAAAVRPAPCGWRIDSDATTAIDAISDLLAGVSLSWVIVDGAIEFRRWEWTAPTRVARSERVTRRRTFKPVTSRKLGYRRNCAPMSRGDLADVVFAQDVIYDDGTPIGDAIEAAATKARWSNVQDDNGARPKNYADVTGANVAAAIAYQGWGATASEAAVSNAQVPIGANCVMNSSFQRGTWGFRIGHPSFNIQVGLPGYYGKRQVAYVQTDTAFGGSTDQYFDIVGFGWWGTSSLSEQARYSVPVKPGDRLGARLLSARHRMSAELWILVFNKDGTLIQGSNGGRAGHYGGGQDGDNYGDPLQHILGVTHPDAAYAQWMLRGISNGMGGVELPYLFFTEPWFGKLAPNQTVIPPYSAGPADPLSDQTATNIAGGIANQGQLATLNQAGAGNLAASAVQRLTYEVLQSAISCPVGN